MVFSIKKLLLALILVSIFQGTVAFAQTASDIIPDDLTNGSAQYDTGPSENDISLDFSPENPGPFQDITVRTSSDYIDLNRYHASWFVNGKKIAEGIGQRTATFKTSGYGQPTSLIILIQLPDTLIKKTLRFEPQDMTLLWEAVDAYVPPFYQGKKLLPREGIIKAVAIPNFKNATGGTFQSPNGVYRWLRNDNIVSEATGYGKDFYTFKNNKIRSSEKITATASDTSGDHEATQSITVTTSQPKVLFYEKNQKTGIINPVSKKTLRLIAPSSTIIAEPFFMSVAQGNPNSLSYQWTMNESPISLADTNNQTTITLQNPGGTGNATLGLTLKNPNSLFQNATSALAIIFSK